MGGGRELNKIKFEKSKKRYNNYKKKKDDQPNPIPTITKNRLEIPYMQKTVHEIT